VRSKRRGPSSRVLCIAPVLALLPALLPGQAPASGPAPGAVPGPPAARATAEPPWVPVHPERQARLAGTPVHGICFGGTPPRKVAGGPPWLPPDSPLRRTGGVIVAHCLVDDEGYVVAFQVLKAPAGTDSQTVAGALAAWRYEPARQAGRPVAVHYTVAIPLPRDPTP
jgi:Gram-negative bacterial TonB protein C-terminal